MMIRTKLLGLLGLFVSVQGCTKRGAEQGNIHRRWLPVEDLPNLHIYIEADLYQSTVLSRYGYVYESLLSSDRDTYEPIGSLAKSWSISEDKKAFTFEIHEDAKWFDGTPVTANDVAFTYEQVFAKDSRADAMKAFYGSIDPKVEVVSDKKLIIRAKTLHFNNLSLAGGIPIIPKHLLQDKEFNKALLTETFGSGPYMLDSWERGSRITLKKNPNYWGAALPHNQGVFSAEKIIFRFVKESKVAMELLKSGFWTSYSFRAEDWELEHKDPKVQKAYDTYSYTNKSPPGYSFIAWNPKNELFRDKQVRIALSHLVNRDETIQKFYFGHARKAIGPINSTSDYAPKDLQPIDYDPSKAVAILKDQGWKDSNNDGVLDKGGKKFEFVINYSNPKTERDLTIYKEDLKKVGIVANLQQLDWTAFTKKLDERNFDSIILAWSASVDPDLKQIWHSTSAASQGSNFVSYNNPEVDRLIELAQGEFDRSKRIEINQKIARLIAADAPYTFYLEQPVAFVAADKRYQRIKDYFNYELGHDTWQLKAE